MSGTEDRLTTAEGLSGLSDQGQRCELVDGVLRMMSPAGGRHGAVAGELFLQVASYVKQHRLGRTFAAETGFVLRRDPDTVLAPDVAFVSHARLGNFTRHPGYLPMSPELVAEVVSPHDRWSDVEAKVQLWLRAGARVVLVVDPQAPAVRACWSDGQVQVCSEGFLLLDDVLSGFQLDVTDLFA
ncbi:MAG: Uma2 family endonuclease [Pirellulaceae bacterium]|nr:Uma2 family endonuclease [Pirellulaceae bacterium]